MARSLARAWLVGVWIAGCSKPGPDVHATESKQDPIMEPDRVQTPPSIALEDVAKIPEPGTVVPAALGFSPDDRLVTFLFSEEGTLTRTLYAIDVDTGTRREIVQPTGGGATEDNLSHEEKLRRERMRERGLGITRYAWSEFGSTLLVPLQGGIWVKDRTDGPLRELVAAGTSPLLDPQLSRDGSAVAYVQDAELHVASVRDGRARQLTTGARGTGKTHGLAEYIAQEEMSRHHGYWWSRDGRWIAYEEVDETAIPIFRIEHQGKDAPTNEDHRYPFAGSPNARVRLGVVPATGGRTVWMDLRMENIPTDADGFQDIYLARVTWMPDGSLMAQLENREQTRLDLVRFDPETGRGVVVLREQTEPWINLHDVFEPLEKASGDLAGSFVWGSERSGFRHLYHYQADGRLIRQLTEGDWMVDDVVGVDEDGKLVYFMATRDGPTERHLYAVPLAGGEIRRITREPGTHGVVLDHGFRRFVDIHSSTTRPPIVTLCSLADGTPTTTIHDRQDPRVQQLGLRAPELVTLTSRDGETLHGALYRPPGDPHRAPVVVSVYGGPHAQRVTNSWGMTADMRAQFLAAHGYLVWKLDNRGSSRRGLKFEGAIARDMGNLEVRDQVDGVRWLVGEGLADPDRVAIYGWSYGGYMAAMSLARAPETFKVAIAGAPVTHWDGYDTHYTERYMGTPQSNPDGYRRSSVMEHVGNMVGKLMLVHGLIDENVHFRHTARLVNSLITARKEYELLLFPDERHMPRREEDRVYMEQRIFRFLRSHL